MNNIINIARSIAGYEHERVSRLDIQYNEISGYVGYLTLVGKAEMIQIHVDGSFEECL